MASSEPAMPRSMLFSQSMMWQEAYDCLDEKLRQRYETLLQAELKITTSVTLEKNAARLAEVMSQRVQNRQWTYKWRGRPKKVRDQLETVLGITQKCADIISAGVKYAPPYVSLPWTAVTLLLPLVTAASKQQIAAMNGLEKITVIMGRYAIVESAHLHLQSPSAPELQSAMGRLYRKIVEYQARLADYLGKSTLRRFGYDALDLSGWSDLEGEIGAADQACLALLQLSGSETLQARLLDQTLILEGIENSIRSSQDENNHYEILNWLWDHDPFDDHMDVREMLGEEDFGSGRWLFELKTYEAWNMSRTGMFVIKGSIGTGKSSIVSILIEDLLKHSAEPVAFHYCSQKDNSPTKAASRSIEGVILPILRQLATHRDGRTMNSVIAHTYKLKRHTLQRSLRLSQAELLDLFVDVIEDRSGATVVIDALDEFAQHTNLLDFLSEAANRTKLKILCSTRPHVRVRDHFPPVVEIDMADHNSDDIAAYLKLGLFGTGKPGPWGVPSEYQAAELRKVLQDQSCGMFRWVRLQHDLFSRIDLADDFDDKLERLKRLTLESSDELVRLHYAYSDMYDLNLGRESQHSEVMQTTREQLIKKMFSWALYSFRPLTLAEMLEAIGTDDRGSRVRGIDEDFLLIRGSNFIRLDARGFIVFTHLSAREYLLHANVQRSSVGSSSPGCAAHGELTSRCLRSVLDQPLATIGYEFLQYHRSTGSIRNFRTYCNTYWPQHFRASKDGPSSTKNVEALEARIKLLGAMVGETRWNHLCRSNIPRIPQADARPELEPLASLIFTCIRELVSMAQDDVAMDLVQCLVALEIPLDAHPPGEGSMINFAVVHSPELVEMLLYCGARPDKLTPDGQTSLHLAAMQQKGSLNQVRPYDITRLLLQYAAETKLLTVTDHEGRTSLQMALEEHNFDCADVLWRSMLDTNEDEISDYSAILYARSLGRGRNRAPERTFTGKAYGFRFAQSSFCDSCLDLISASGSRSGLHIAISKRTELLHQTAAGGCPLCTFFITHCLDERMPVLQNSRGGKTGLRLSSHGVDLYDMIKSWVLFTHWSRMTVPVSIIVATIYSAASASWTISIFASLCVVLWIFEVSRSPYQEIMVRLQSLHRRHREQYMNLFTTELSKAGKVLSEGKHEFELCYKRASADKHAADVCNMPISTYINEELNVHFPSSPLHRNTFDTDALKMVQGWLSECRYHAYCKQASSPIFPAWILDVSSPDRMMLCEGVSASGAYCYLSHIRLDNVVATTTRSNLDRYRKGIDPMALPNNWRDASELTRVLGFRYLWIDALCMIQDDATSWLAEAQNLPEYIRNASLVIAATSNDPWKGLKSERSADDELLNVQYSYVDSQDLFHQGAMSGRLSIRRPLSDSSDLLTQCQWATRAWTLPERYLARRIIFYGEEQIYWNCNTCLYSEGSVLPQNSLWRLADSKFPGLLEPLGKRSTWYDLIEYHTAVSSQLTYIGDRRSIIAILATAWSDLEAYRIGLWTDDIHVGLLWRRRGLTQKPAESDVPSWSWAGITGAVTFMVSHLSRVETEDDGVLCSVKEAYESEDYPQGSLEHSRLRFEENIALQSHTKAEVRSVYKFVDGEHQDLKTPNARVTTTLVFQGLTRPVKGPQALPDHKLFFDSVEVEKQWRESCFQVVLLMISRWEMTTRRGLREHGLILQLLIDSQPTYQRIGVYTGPIQPLVAAHWKDQSPTDYSRDSLWKREEVHII